MNDAHWSNAWWRRRLRRLGRRARRWRWRVEPRDSRHHRRAAGRRVSVGDGDAATRRPGRACAVAGWRPALVAGLAWLDETTRAPEARAVSKRPNPTLHCRAIGDACVRLCWPVASRCARGRMPPRYRADMPANAVAVPVLGPGRSGRGAVGMMLSPQRLGLGGAGPAGGLDGLGGLGGLLEGAAGLPAALAHSRFIGIGSVRLTPAHWSVLAGRLSLSPGRSRWRGWCAGDAPAGG